MKKIEARIADVKAAIMALGDMRPGHLSRQRRSHAGRSSFTCHQLSYTFRGRSRTDYVKEADVERVSSEIENYAQFRTLCEKLVELSVALSKSRSEKGRRNARKST